MALAPHVRRWLHPSIFGDDVVRVFLLQTHSLVESLTTPFNEHLAPVFDGVSWLAYTAAGGTLTAIPRAFTSAAFVPFVLALAVLAGFARRELGTWSAAGLVVAAFAVAPIHVVETVWWYSGSNHMWALIFVLLALIGVGKQGATGLVLVAMGSALAPACSLMGVIGGPVCLAFALGRGGRRALGVALASGAGLVAYAAFGMAFGLVGAMLHARRVPSDPILGLKAAAEVPASVLLPALLGGPDLSGWVPWAGLAASTAVLAFGTLIWAARSPSRGLILAGLVLILGNYLLIYPFRTAGGRDVLIRAARYHMFPQLGLALLIGAAARRRLAGPNGPSWALAGFAGLLAIHGARMWAEASLYDYPNQARTFAALEKVRATCLSEGITARQAIAALEPIRPHWMPFEVPGASATPLIGPIEVASRVPDDQVRARLLAPLDLADKEGLFGGMDVRPYLVPLDRLPSGPPLPVEREALHRIRPDGLANAFFTDGWPSHLEYRIDAPPDQVARSRWLALPVASQEGGIELWWDDGQGHWSDGRSVLWNYDRSAARIWAVPLDRLPHWDGPSPRRLRVVFRFPERVFTQPPRLLP